MQLQIVSHMRKRYVVNLWDSQMFKMIWRKFFHYSYIGNKCYWPNVLMQRLQLQFRVQWAPPFTVLNSWLLYMRPEVHKAGNIIIAFFRGVTPQADRWLPELWRNFWPPFLREKTSIKVVHGFQTFCTSWNLQGIYLPSPSFPLYHSLPSQNSMQHNLQFFINRS